MMKKTFVSILLVFALLAVMIPASIADGDDPPVLAKGMAQWLAAATEEAQKADHVIGGENGIDKKGSLTIIGPGETVAIIPDISMNHNGIQGGITSYGGKVIQLNDPVVNTDCLKTSTPETTVFTELITNSLPYFYGDRDETGDPVRIVEGADHIDYVRLYRNDTGLPVVLRGQHWQSGRYTTTKSMNAPDGVGKADEFRTVFQTFITINYAPIFYFVEPTYDLNLRTQTSGGTPYEWAVENPQVIFKVYMDNQDHEYVIDNPMVPEWSFTNWKSDNHVSVTPIDSEGVIANGKTTFTNNIQQKMDKIGDLNPGVFARDVLLMGYFFTDCHTVRFYGNDGTVNGMEALMVEAGRESVTLNPGDYKAVREGYDFVGWCTDPENPEETMLPEDATAENADTWFKNRHMNLYAVWQIQNKIKAFVTRCYSIILGRAPDAGGLQTWFEQLSTGKKTASEIIDRFVNSPEFTGKNYSDGDKVDILYQAMLGRNADEGGKQNWVRKLENGQTLAHVINGFCFSKEFRGLCESYGIKAGFVTIPDDDPTPEGKIKSFIQRCYRIILDREADASGLQTWYNELSSKRKAASEIIDRFVNSPEFLGKNYSNGEAVEILYKAMLGRTPDEAGKAHWVGKLDAGQPFAAVINGFCTSNEFRGICESYGIEPGSVKVNQARLDEPISRTVIEGSGEEETASAAREIILTDEQAEDELDTAVMVVYYNRDKVTAFIRRCYNTILERNETEEAINNWVEQILNGAKTPDQIIRGFLFSGEFQAKNTANEDLVKILYKVYMNRDADPEGLATWTGKLDAGMTLKELADTFARTGEYRKMVQGLEE